MGRLMAGYICRCGAMSDKKRCQDCVEKQPKNPIKYAPRESPYDHRWDVLSKRLRRQRPLCEICKAAGRTTVSSEVHHIVPIRDRPDLMYVESNLQAICHECHEDEHGERLPHNGRHQYRGGASSYGG